MKMRIEYVGLLLILGALPGHGAEEAVLRNGYAIQHNHRALLGNTTRLYLTAGNDDYIDVASIQIDHFATFADPPEAPVTGPHPARDSGSHSITAEAVNQASVNQQIDPDLIQAIIRAESASNPNAISKKGARGLMQLMPKTAAGLGVKDVFDPQQNVSAGVSYFNGLLARYHYDLVKALAAYNSGSGSVDRYHGVPPYRETRAYVARIVREFNKAKAAEKGDKISVRPRGRTALPDSHKPPAAGIFLSCLDRNSL